MALVTEHLQICGTCFGLHGCAGTNRQLCHCASTEEHRALSEASYEATRTYWHYVAEICHCCGAEVVDASHKFSVWFCSGCLPRVRALNLACGRCAIPIGRHSMVNGVFVPSNRCRTLTGATGVADELSAFVRETISIGEWAKRIVERHWREAELPVGQHIPVDHYLNAIWARWIDKEALFDELVATRGISPDWRDFEAIPLEPIWPEEAPDAQRFSASDGTEGSISDPGSNERRSE